MGIWLVRLFRNLNQSTDLTWRINYIQCCVPFYNFIMKLKRFTKEKSSRFIVEKHKPIIPTIIYWNEKIGNHQLITFKFSFWKWWYKIGFMLVS